MNAVTPMSMPLSEGEEEAKQPSQDTSPHGGRCHVCGGKLGVLVRVEPETNGPAVIYYTCERCDQVLVRRR